MPILVLLVLIVVGAVVLWRSLRARRALARLRALQQAASAPTLAEQKRELTQALTTLAVDDITAARMESSARAWLPTFDDTRSAQQPMRPLTTLVAAMRQNSLVLTGLEQALLRSPALSASVEHLALLDYSLMAPSGVEAAANQILLEMAHNSGAEVIRTGAQRVVMQTLDALHGQVIDQLGASIADPLLLAEAINHFAMDHVVAGPALFDALANHGDAVKIGIEFAQNMLHMPELAAAAGTHGIDALQAASQLLMEQGLSVGQASAEAWLQQHADYAAGHMQALMAQHAEASGGSIFHGVPIISGLVLGYQEFKILQRGDATLGTVGKNWAIDFGSRLIGGNIGAAIGTAVFPGPGTVVGGIAGAVLFSMFGGRIKEHDMRAAAEQCKDLSGRVQAAVQHCEDTGIPLAHHALDQARAAYLGSIGSIPRLDTTMPPESFQAITQLREDVAATLRNDQQVVANALRVSKGGWFSHPFVGVTASDLQLASQMQQRLTAAQMALPSASDLRAHPFTQLGRLVQAADIPVEPQRQAAYRQTLRARFAAAQSGMPRFRRLITGWNQQALKAYGVALAAIEPTVTQQLDAYTEAVQPLFEQLQLAVTTYDKEAAKLGKRHK